VVLKKAQKKLIAQRQAAGELDVSERSGKPSGSMSEAHLHVKGNG
jgi:hypothetical protein